MTQIIKNHPRGLTEVLDHLKEISEASEAERRSREEVASRAVEQQMREQAMKYTRMLTRLIRDEAAPDDLVELQQRAAHRDSLRELENDIEIVRRLLELIPRARSIHEADAGLKQEILHREKSLAYIEMLRKEADHQLSEARDKMNKASAAASDLGGLIYSHASKFFYGNPVCFAGDGQKVFADPPQVVNEDFYLTAAKPNKNETTEATEVLQP